MTTTATIWAATLEELTAAGEIEEVGRLKIHRSEKTMERPCVKIWRGKARKPYANFWFPTHEAREQYIADQIKYDRQALESEEEIKATRKARTAEMRAKITVGTILHCSWGYDQTNCDFYQVIERPSPAIAIICRIGSKTVEGSEQFMSDRRKPARDQFIGEPQRRTIGAFGCKVTGGTADPIDENGAFSCSWYH